LFGYRIIADLLNITETQTDKIVKKTQYIYTHVECITPVDEYCHLPRESQ